MASAADLNVALDAIVSGVRTEFVERDLHALRIGEFKNAHSSAGRRIESELNSRLGAVGIAVAGPKESAPELHGELRHFDAGEYAASLLIVHLEDAQGVEIESFRQRLDAATQQARTDLRADLTEPPSDAELSSGAVIDDAQDVALLHGATVDVLNSVQKSTELDLLPTKGVSVKTTKVSVRPQSQMIARVAVDQSIREAVLNPGFHLTGTSLLSSSADSPFRIELLATPPGALGPYTEVPLIDVDGRAFAQFREGQHYAIRIKNDSPIDVGVELSIDGINSLTLSQVESYRRIGKWVIPAGKSGLIRGWQTERSAEERFLVTSAEQGVAAALGRPQEIGMISAAFYPAWTGDEPPPFERLVAGSTRRIATGRGPIVDVQDRSQVRSFGTEPLSVVTVRYHNPE
ncbi:MAG: hypothetical protein KDA75_03295 [Planctomycetaceae bacterium]|nr:hypothetical protein [Planctomycetaceae bacterium]